MFSGLSRRRDNVKTIRLGSVSNITLAGDDPDFIVIEVFNLAFDTSKINLPRTAPIGKVFKFALTTAPKENPTLTTHYVDIIVPLKNGVGVDSVWRMFSGQRPIFIYGQNGWVSEGGNLLSTSGLANSADLAVGSHANGSNNGASVGYNSNGSISGSALGYNSNGYLSGAAVGNTANGSDS